MSIEQLTKRVHDKQAALEAEHRRKALTEREVIIKQALPIVDSIDFYCDRCRADFRSRGYKTVQKIFDPPIAFYEGRCRCGTWCRRFITDQSQDPYYRKSRRVKELAERFRKDMLQPGEPGFKTLYGDPYAKFYEEMERQERAKWQKKPSVTV